MIGGNELDFDGLESWIRLDCTTSSFSPLQEPYRLLYYFDDFSHVTESPTHTILSCKTRCPVSMSSSHPPKLHVWAIRWRKDLSIRALRWRMYINSSFGSSLLLSLYCLLILQVLKVALDHLMSFSALLCSRVFCFYQNVKPSLPCCLFCSSVGMPKKKDVAAILCF